MNSIIAWILLSASNQGMTPIAQFPDMLSCMEFQAEYGMSRAVGMTGGTSYCIQAKVVK
jgi:hypothetical protein